MNNGSTVLLLSGGLDSSVLLYYLGISTNLVYPITINYGQKHSKEIAAADKVAASRGLVTYHVDLSHLDVFKGSSLTSKFKKIPTGEYTLENMSSTVVPNRNMVFLSIAAAYAVSCGASQVAYAAHSGDHYIYPDCRPEFIEAMSRCLYLATGVGLYTPFMSISKADIVRAGLELSVPFELTWSCYNGGDFPCLQCGTCVERTNAFMVNNTKDPLIWGVQ